MALVRFERDEALGIITLASPPLNLVSQELAQDLIEAVARSRNDDGLRGLLLRAEGDAFSAGADVNMFRDQTAESGRELLAGFVAAIRDFESLPFPTVASVQGMCLAGGFELALACDLIWASDDALLGLVEAVIGATPFGGGSQRLAARAGVARAREAVFSARMYTAQAMADWGVVNRVVATSELATKTLAFAKSLAEGPTVAHAATKRFIRTFVEQGMAAADALLPELGGQVMASTDVQEGVRSLLEKGPGHAVFEGR